MDYKTKWKYRQTINKALRDTNYDILNFFLLVLLIGMPVGLIVKREMPGMVLGFILLPLPILYFMTFYRWHSEGKRGLQGFGSSASVTVGEGMLDIDDGKARASILLENIRELAVFIPKGEKDPSYWWIVALKGLEYLLPKDTGGLENLLREFRDDPVFDTHPVDREDIKPGRWTIWEKEGAS